MKYRFSENFTADLGSFPEAIQKKFWKQLKFLLSDIRHPSLRAKKYNETNDVWQARVDQNIRFYFLIENNTYVLLDIKNHPK